jgi:hypothetical protein
MATFSCYLLCIGLVRTGRRCGLWRTDWSPNRSPNLRRTRDAQVLDSEALRPVV